MVLIKLFVCLFGCLFVCLFVCLFDQFSDDDIHFLDIQILPNGTTVYRKQTHTGQYQHFSSYAPWSRKIAGIRALIHRAHKICSNDDRLQK